MADLLSLPQSDSESIANTPIHLDHPANIVRNFVELICSALFIPDIPFKEGCTVLELCDRFQAPRIEKQILKGLRCRAKEAPWDTFKLAARKKDVELAKAAIAHFPEDGTPLSRFPRILDSDKRAEIAEITPTWLYALLICRLHQRFLSGEEWLVGKSSWADGANHFYPGSVCGGSRCE